MRRVPGGRVTIGRAVYALCPVLASLGVIVVGVALLLRMDALAAWLSLGVAVLNVCVYMMLRRIVRDAVRLGATHERIQTLTSMSEAERRGMKPHEWLSSYVERVGVELVRDGRLRPDDVDPDAGRG